MPSAESWAAIAAIFSAVAAFISLRQQKLNRIDSQRPYLSIDEIEVHDKSNRLEFTIGKVRNIGNGVALRVRPLPWVTERKKDFESFKAGISNNPINAIASKEEVNTDWKGRVSWEIAEINDQHAKMIVLKVGLIYYDAEWNQYSQDYHLSFQFGAIASGGIQRVGDGIYLSTGRVRIKSRLKYRLEGKLRSVHLAYDKVIKMIRKKA